MPSVKLQRLGDGEAAAGHDGGHEVCPYCGDGVEAEKGKHRHRHALAIGRETTQSGSLLVSLAAVVASSTPGGGPAMPKGGQDFECVCAFAVGGEPARRFRQVKAQHPDDQRADAISTKMPRQPSESRKTSAKTDRRGPGQRAAAEMHQRHVAATHIFWRELGGVSKGQSNLGAQP